MAFSNTLHYFWCETQRPEEKKSDKDFNDNAKSNALRFSPKFLTCRKHYSVPIKMKENAECINIQAEIALRSK